jgi:hypothetical protein
MSLFSALDECELTGPWQSRCAHCLDNLPDDADPVRTSLLDSLSDWVRADHPRRYVACGDRFPTGVEIVPEGDGWRADCCPRRLRFRRRRPRSPGCRPPPVSQADSVATGAPTH